MPPRTDETGDTGRARAATPHPDQAATEFGGRRAGRSAAEPREDRPSGHEDPHHVHEPRSGERSLWDKDDRT